jgi:PPP family 3-phenylpropionic acid transporter
MSLAARPTSQTSVLTRLAFFYIAVFLLPGIAMPFWPAWLAAHGLDAVQIGTLLALGPWTKLVSNPLAARLADRSGKTRRLLVLLALGGLASYALFGLVDGFVAFFIVTILANLALNPIMPLGDSVTLGTGARHGIAYGRVRLWGSLSFMVAGGGAGFLLAGRPPDLILALLLGALLVLVLACFGLPETADTPPPQTKLGWHHLFADRRFCLFLAVVSLIQASHVMFYGFGSLHWLAAGYGKAAVGALWAICIPAEVALFALGGRLVDRLRPAGLLLLGGSAGILRWTLLAASTDLPLLVIAQLLHAFTFAATHLATMYFFVREVPPGLAATAQGLYGALAGGAVLGATMFVAGILYASHGGAGFLAMAAMCVVATAGAAVLLKGTPR